MKPTTTSPWRLLLILLAVLSLVAAACGGDDDSSDDAASEETETAADAGSEEEPDTAEAEAEAEADGEAATEGSGDDIVLAFARFFGDCEEDVAGVTDVSQATTECEVIQIIENAFNAEDNGIRVEKIGGQAWGDYYTQLTTAFAGGELPVVGVMHQHRLPDYAGRGLLMPLDEAFADSEVIDFDDYAGPAQAAAQLDGTTYALPFDIHASLWHLNVDLFEAAGLTDADGNPIAPTSPDELIEQCEAIEAATDAQCFGHDWFEFGVGARLFLGLVQQQGGSLTDDSGAATPNTPEGQEALALLNRLAEYSDVTQGYTDSQNAFLNGDVAILHNGTWVVDQYDRETDFNYIATNVPTLYDTPSVWGDSHMWVLPMASNEDPEVNAAAVTFLEYLYENIPGWAKGTGHIAPRISVLSGDELADAPQRANYADTASNTGLVPAVPGWAGAWDALAEEVNATWITGKDQATALADAEARMNDALS